MRRANYNQRCAFHRLVRLNSGYGRRLALSDLRDLYRIAMEDSMAGAYSGYAP